MNWLERRQTKEREELRERNAEDDRKFALAEERVVRCTHDWQPVHKWLHKEYLHCPKCGAIKHQDGTIWFFADHQPYKLIIKTG
jgi:transcription elongation factor Elf1